VYSVFDENLSIDPTSFSEEFTTLPPSNSGDSYVFTKSIFVSTGTNWTVDMSTVPAWVYAVTPRSG
jgi:hypothetical protein